MHRESAYCIQVRNIRPQLLGSHQQGAVRDVVVGNQKKSTLAGAIVAGEQALVN